MAILSKGNTFATGEQVTAAKLNNLVDNATFASGAVDDSTTALDGNGKIIVKDSGITSAKLNLSATGASQNIITFNAVQGGSERQFHIRTPASTTDFNSPFEFFTANSFKFLIDSNEIVMDETGQVGIGTTAPDGKLHVGTGTNTDGTDLSVVIGGDTANSRQSIIKKKIQSDDRALEIFASGSTANEEIRLYSSTSKERVRIGGTGVVQIFGTDSTGNCVLQLNSTDTDDTSALQFGNVADDVEDVGQISYSHTNNAMIFRANSAEKMRIASDGSLLVSNIPSSAPSTPSGGGKLYVQGGALKYIGSSGTVTTIANA